MNEYRQTFDTRPIAKERAQHRFGQGSYTPPRTRTFEAYIKRAYNGPKFDGPVYVEATFDKNKIELYIRKLDPEAKSPLRGDVDNYTKSLFDGLNQVAWDDDKQVHQMKAVKK